MADGAGLLFDPADAGDIKRALADILLDAELRARDPSWGIRDLDDISALARQHGFKAPERIAMPANNLSVVFRRR